MSETAEEKTAREAAEAAEAQLKKDEKKTDDLAKKALSNEELEEEVECLRQLITEQQAAITALTTAPPQEFAELKAEVTRLQSEIKEILENNKKALTSEKPSPEDKAENLPAAEPKEEEVDQPEPKPDQDKKEKKAPKDRQPKAERILM